MIPINKMTFSGLERYARIVETVRNSDRHMSAADRMGLIDYLLEKDGNPTIAEIESECSRIESEQSGNNMINAMILRDAHRGY